MELLRNYVSDVRTCENPPHDYALVDLAEGLRRIVEEQSTLVYFEAAGKCWIVPAGRQVPPTGHRLFTINHDQAYIDWSSLPRFTAELRAKVAGVRNVFREILSPEELAAVAAL